MIPVCSSYMLFLRGMLCINTVSQYRTVHKENINFKFVSKYCILCTTQVHENNINVSTESPIHAQRFIFYHHVTWYLTATNIDLALYFKKSFFETLSLVGGSTLTMILISFFRFFSKLFVSHQ